MTTVKFGELGKDLVPGDLTLKYCPDWTAPRKKGRPKANKCQKSGAEIAMGGKGSMLLIRIAIIVTSLDTLPINVSNAMRRRKMRVLEV